MDKHSITLSLHFFFTRAIVCKIMRVEKIKQKSNGYACKNVPKTCVPY